MHEVDHVGNGTFQITQLNLLQRRSLEYAQSKDADLSARGLKSRTWKHYAQTVRVCTNTIRLGEDIHSGAVGTAAGGAVGEGDGHGAEHFRLLPAYFNRALASEKLGRFEEAEADYDKVLHVQEDLPQAYFNRANVRLKLGKHDAALADLDRAIHYRPLDRTLRCNRSLLLRQMGKFIEATDDVIASRYLESHPEIELDPSRDIPRINPDDMIREETEEDPIITALSAAAEDRTSQEIAVLVDFLRGVHFFAGLRQNPGALRALAMRLQLEHFEENAYLFHEGDEGDRLYIIFDGVVALVKESVEPPVVLTHMFRGHVFGETALDSAAGVRSAGAYAEQPVRAITVHREPYLKVTEQYRTQIRQQVERMLHNSPVFSNWPGSKIRAVARGVVVQFFAAGKDIVRAGDPVERLYIVKRGVVLLKKRVLRSTTDPRQADSPSGLMQLRRGTSTLIEAPGMWVIEKNWRDRLDVFDHSTDSSAFREEDYVNFTVGVVGSGQVFGELSILDPDRRSPVTVCTNTNCEVYSIDSELLIKLGARFNATTMNMLNESINMHNPPGEKIAYMFRNRMEWEAQKKKILASILPTLSSNRVGMANKGGMDGDGDDKSGSRQTSLISNPRTRQRIRSNRRTRPKRRGVPDEKRHRAPTALHQRLTNTAARHGQSPDNAHSIAEPNPDATAETTGAGLHSPLPVWEFSASRDEGSRPSSAASNLSRDRDAGYSREDDEVSSVSSTGSNLPMSRREQTRHLAALKSRNGA